MAKDGNSKKRSKQGTLRSPSAADLQAIFQALMKSPAGADEAGADALDRAQSLAFDAMEAPTRARRIALAKQALELSPLCADGHAILAREAATPAAALASYRKAVEAGAQALGEQAFEEDVGYFWGLIETRPYMRARHELAMLLWDMGEHDEAADHYRDMLRLNPNDNQGIRYLLADSLLTLGRDDETAALLKQYKDDWGAAWPWSSALLAFRRKGDSAAARKALAKAVKANPHVPAYLTGRKKLPRTLPDYYSPGDDSEAVSYVHGAASAWAAAPGAAAWVKAFLSGGA